MLAVAARVREYYLASLAHHPDFAGEMFGGVDGLGTRVVGQRPNLPDRLEELISVRCAGERIINRRTGHVVPQTPPATQCVCNRCESDRRYEVNKHTGKRLPDVPEICATREFTHALVSSSSVACLIDIPVDSRQCTKQLRTCRALNHKSSFNSRGRPHSLCEECNLVRKPRPHQYR